MHSYAQCSVIYNSQDLEAAQVPTGKWVDTKAVVYLHNGILHGHKKDVDFTFCNSMNGAGEYYTKYFDF